MTALSFHGRALWRRAQREWALKPKLQKRLEDAKMNMVTGFAWKQSWRRLLEQRGVFQKRARLFLSISEYGKGEVT